MEQPICALCGMPIKPTESKMTVQGVTQHMRCWDKARQRRNAKMTAMDAPTALFD